MLLFLLSLSSYLINESKLSPSSDRGPSSDQTRYLASDWINKFITCSHILRQVPRIEVNPHWSVRSFRSDHLYYYDRIYEPIVRVLCPLISPRMQNPGRTFEPTDAWVPCPDKNKCPPVLPRTSPKSTIYPSQLEHLVVAVQGKRHPQTQRPRRLGRVESYPQGPSQYDRPVGHF